MKLQRKNKYSKRVAVGLLSAALFVNLLGCDKSEVIDEVVNEGVIEETICYDKTNTNIDSESHDETEMSIYDQEYYISYYNITEEEKKERMEKLSIKYPDAKVMLDQVSSIAIKDANGNYKVIQTLNRYNPDTNLITFFDLFTEEKLFDLPYNENWDFDYENNLNIGVDFNTVCNKIPYFDDKEIIEYGICIHSIMFFRNHYYEFVEKRGVQYYYDLDTVYDYLYTEGFIPMYTSFTVKELADNYVTMVPPEFQVNAFDLGLVPTYPIERKYADYWKISDDKKNNRIDELEIVNPEQKLSASIVHTLIIKDKNDNYKLMNVLIQIEGNYIVFSDLYTEQVLFKAPYSGNLSYNGEQYEGVDFTVLEDSLQYFEDKTIVKFCLSIDSNWFVYDNIEIFRKKDEIAYERPDKGCIYYMYPVDPFNLKDVSYTKQEYAECYVVTVPKEMQVATRELTYGLVYDETEKVYKLG